MDFVQAPKTSKAVGDVYVPTLSEARDTFRRANPETHQQIEEGIEFATKKVAGILSKIGLFTVPLVPLSRLGVPETTKPFKTPLPFGLVVGIPAGTALTSMAISTAGDPDATGEGDRKIAESLERARINEARKAMKSPIPPQWNADP